MGVSGSSGEGVEGQGQIGVHAASPYMGGYDFYGDGPKTYLGGQVGVGTTNPRTYKLYVSGSAYSTGGWSSSDRKYKKNIADIDAALEKVLRIRGVSFEWKTDKYKKKGFPLGRHYGVIAQEIEKILPEVVKKDADGEKAVSYNEIIPVLIEAIKAQQQEILTLEKEIADLKKTIILHLIICVRVYPPLRLLA